MNVKQHPLIWQNTGKIPVSYLLQCHYYVMVIGLDTWYIAVLIYGKEFKYQRIEGDEDIISALVKIEKDFRILGRIETKTRAPESAEGMGYLLSNQNKLKLPILKKKD